MLEPVNDDAQEGPSGSGLNKNANGPSPTTHTSNHRVLASLRQPSEDHEDEPSEAGDAGAVEFPENGPSPGRTSSDEDDDSEDDDPNTVRVEGAYDPAEFEHLSVPAEVKELFNHITRYTPQIVELEYRLRPFIPDFIPAVGDIDAFLKIPRPDKVEDGAGLTYLDEPGGKQSDPAVLDLQLRAVAKQSSAKEAVVKRLDNAERNSRTVDKWIRDISDLHRSRPPPAVHYTRPMPDIDSLMQEWPPEVEIALQDQGLPPPDLDSSLETYIDVICGLLDIPIYESRVQSLHVLFSLYSAVKNSKYNPAL